MLDELREEIEETEYWDAKAYDFRCNFLETRFVYIMKCNMQEYSSGCSSY